MKSTDSEASAGSDKAANVYPHAARKEMQRFVPETAARLLDVGCNTGGFGVGLKEARTMEIWGVEANETAARQAEQVLDKVVIGNFGPELGLPAAHFDVVVFNDVLEHMVDPWGALRYGSELLAPDGTVVVSLPNMLHIENLLHLLRERDFHYEETGTRDRTHLRFFTKKSASRMFDECGYTVLRAQGVNGYWWSPSLVRRLAFRFFPKTLEETKYGQFAFVLKARK